MAALHPQAAHGSHEVMSGYLQLMRQRGDRHLGQTLVHLARAAALAHEERCAQAATPAAPAPGAPDFTADSVDLYRKDHPRLNGVSHRSVVAPHQAESGHREVA